MNETRIFADAYQTTFADPKEMLEFLAQRAKESSWIRKPTRTLRLVPAIQEAGKMKDTVGKNWEEILEDTENNTQLALQMWIFLFHFPMAHTEFWNVRPVIIMRVRNGMMMQFRIIMCFRSNIICRL